MSAVYGGDGLTDPLLPHSTAAKPAQSCGEKHIRLGHFPYVSPERVPCTRCATTAEQVAARTQRRAQGAVDR
eukprot:350283-Chlamydomonas_euryale.AAC.4